MSSRTIFLGRLIGLSLLLISLAMLMQGQMLAGTLADFVHNEPLSFFAGMTGVVGGLALILGHNIWAGGALPVIVTIIGWVTLLKSLLIMAFPAAIARLFEQMQLGDYTYLSAIVPLIVGGYLTYAGFTAHLPQPSGKAQRA